MKIFASAILALLLTCGGASAEAVQYRNADGINNDNVSIATPLPVTLPPGASTSALQPTNAAAGSTTSGQTGTLGMCGTVNSPPSNTNAQTNPILCGTRGQILVGPSGINGTSLSAQGAYTPYDYSGSARAPAVAPMLYDGTNINIGLGCTSTAVVNVTAGSTAQIVGLVSAKQVRVCAFSVAMSAAGTAKWVYGTGTNCGAGTTDITGAIPLATGTPWALSSAEGQLFATASANELCMVAVTGNVVGYVSYAQF